MKRKLNLFFATSLLTSSSLTALVFVVNFNEANNQIINLTSSNVDNQTATKYANETSIVGKSLLIGQNQNFNTNDLLNNMYGQNQSKDINNLKGDNSGNDFIKNWTTNLDGNSINTIQPLFQRHGANQDSIDKITKNISSYQKYATYLPMIKSYLNNSFLSQDKNVDLIDTALKLVKGLIPNIDNYLSYSTYLPMATSAVKELLSDWDQPQDFSGDNLLAKMKDYMSKKGTYAQAWQKLNDYDNWHYVETRASGWNWTQFYEYMAGVNFNYIFKLISGKYIGDMIADNITTTVGLPTGFNTDGFLKTFTDTISKIVNTPAALPYLIKTIVPVLKAKVLKMENPTLGINSVTWNDDSANKDIAIKTVLLELQHLLSSAGHNDLISLISDLLGGPFGEDIVIKATGWPVTSYWTLPEIFSKFSFIISIHDIATKVADSLTDALKSIPIDDYINKVLDFTNKYLTTNPVIKLQDLSKYLDLTVDKTEFTTALNDIKDIIDNPSTTTHNVKEVLTILGVQFNGETTFKVGSVLDSLSAWLNTPNSSINQLLGIIQGDKNHPGIINNMITEQERLYQDEYTKYFDISNTTYFMISDVKMKKYKEDNGITSAVLSYQMLNKLNGNHYQISFTNNDFVNTKDFKLTLFHQI
ncbi:hypothetical protein [Spiroplasma endosymbiont of Virgichneumon dumeticola]|uniref:hypothetical protein n=1 Tax=Spiroplasma endosymbiont of Virgichneumon dumeticola TaxID=3139323 RepID=UPI0035C93ECB